MNEEYDFFGIGQRHATDSIIELKKLAETYGEKYGKEAKEKFELGIVSVVPQYVKIYQDYELNENINDTINSTKDYGVPNTRNNSYFGSSGTGVQYYTLKDGSKVFNEPSSKKTK